VATFTSFFPGGVNPDHYSPPLPGFDYMPFFEEIVNANDAVRGTTTSTAIDYDLANGLKLKLIGTGFAFDSNGDPTGGTITAIAVYLNDGTTRMQVLTGLNILLKAFSDAVDVSTPHQVAQLLMGGNDILKGSAGDQDLIGYGGNDRFIGGSGNDFVYGGEGKDTYDGNGGSFDTLNFDEASSTSTAFRGINLDASTGKVIDAWGNTETFTEFEQFRGTKFADLFKGSGANETFMGLGGADKINGGLGSDTALYHRDDRRGGTGGVTVDLQKGKAHRRLRKGRHADQYRERAHRRCRRQTHRQFGSELLESRWRQRFSRRWPGQGHIERRRRKGHVLLQYHAQQVDQRRQDSGF
jgi:serralysin